MPYAILQTQTYLHDVNFTFAEVIQLLILIISILGTWIAVKIKIAKLETMTADNKIKVELQIEGMRNEFDIRLKAMDSKTVGLADFLSTRLAEFVAHNKEDHIEIKDSVDHIVETVNAINIKLAKLPS